MFRLLDKVALTRHIVDMKNKLSLYLFVAFLAVSACLSFSLLVSRAATEQKMQMQVKFVNPKDKQEEKVAPRIDEEAASIVREENVEKPASAKASTGEENIYTQNFWALLFGAYIFLMIFNLSFDFGKKKKVQWLLEAVLTFLAIFVWDQLDFARVNSWFPAVILESGIIIYGFYFYFIRKRLSLDFENKSN